MTLLRRALRALPGFFISHLPVEGARCVEALKRSDRGAVWMSPWAVSNAKYVASHLEGARFVVINAEGQAHLPVEVRCLHLSEAALASEPDDEVRRLVLFLRDER